jgi:hypothetical protein
MSPYTTFAKRNGSHVIIRVGHFEIENTPDDIDHQSPGEATIKRLADTLVYHGVMAPGSERLGSDNRTFEFEVPEPASRYPNVDLLIGSIYQEVTGVAVNFSGIPDEFNKDWSSPPPPPALLRRIWHWISNTYSNILLEHASRAYTRSVIRRQRRR